MHLLQHAWVLADLPAYAMRGRRSVAADSAVDAVSSLVRQAWCIACASASTAGEPGKAQAATGSIQVVRHYLMTFTAGTHDGRPS
jgi:hypothetical protein